MFRRRIPHTLRARAREFLWPRAGWRRSARYVAHRIGRLPVTPHEVAAGLAAGVAVSFLPLNGLHLLLAGLLALATRGSIVAAAVGTLVGNPWTFPFIWIASYQLGVWMIPDLPDEPIRRVGPFVRVFADLFRAVLTFDLRLFAERVWPIWLPMMVGSLPLAVLFWAVTYWPVRAFVRAYRNRKGARRANPRVPQGP